jgi:large subunit ribosomal protein L4
VADPLKIQVFSQAKQPVGEVELASAIFDQPLRSHLLYETVKMQRANRRRGTHSTKTRAFVRGGGKKPWKQKGTGRARQGSTRAAQWVGGATVFGPLPRDYSYRMPLEARRQALCVALSAKKREERILVLDRLEIASGKTRDMAKMIADLGLSSALVVVRASDPTLARAARNLRNVKVIQVAGVNVYDLLDHEHVIITAEALKSLEERLERSGSAAVGRGPSSTGTGGDSA